MLAQQTQQFLDVLKNPESDERAIKGAADQWVKTLQNPDRCPRFWKRKSS